VAAIAAQRYTYPDLLADVSDDDFRDEVRCSATTQPAARSSST
jgi:hypothetical protein